MVCSLRVRSYNIHIFEGQRPPRFSVICSTCCYVLSVRTDKFSNFVYPSFLQTPSFSCAIFRFPKCYWFSVQVFIIFINSVTVVFCLFFIIYMDFVSFSAFFTDPMAYLQVLLDKVFFADLVKLINIVISYSSKHYGNIFNVLVCNFDCHHYSRTCPCQSVQILLQFLEISGMSLIPLVIKVAA